MLVFLGHGFDIFHPRPHPIWGVLATCSVLIFFGLSGFFIHKALAKSMARDRLLSFAVGRINRILPPFAVSMLLVVVLWALAPFLFASHSRSFLTATARSEFSLDGLISSVLLLNGFVGPTLSANGPLWSLSYEVWYYVAAWLVGIAIVRQWKWPVAASVALVLALTVANPKFAIFGVIWLLGFGLSALHGLDRIPKFPEWPLLALATISVVLAALTLFKGAQLIANFVVGLWFVAHMARVLRGGAIRQFGPLERSSHFAYALYVMHFPLLLFAYGAIGERSWLMVPVMLAILVVMALFGRRIEEMQPIAFPRR